MHCFWCVVLTWYIRNTPIMATDKKPHALDFQAKKLRDQLLLTETLKSIALALLEGMLNVEPGEKVKPFDRISGKAAIKTIYQNTRTEIEAVHGALTELLEMVQDKKYRDGSVSEDESTNLDFEVTGTAVAWISRLGNVGPNLVKALEWLHKVNPDSLGTFASKVSDAMRLVTKVEA